MYYLIIMNCRNNTGHIKAQFIFFNYFNVFFSFVHYDYTGKYFDILEALLELTMNQSFKS